MYVPFSFLQLTITDLISTSESPTRRMSENSIKMPLFIPLANCTSLFLISMLFLISVVVKWQVSCLEHVEAEVNIYKKNYNY